MARVFRRVRGWSSAPSGRRDARRRGIRPAWPGERELPASRLARERLPLRTHRMGQPSRRSRSRDNSKGRNRNTRADRDFVPGVRARIARAPVRRAGWRGRWARSGRRLRRARLAGRDAQVRDCRDLRVRLQHQPSPAAARLWPDLRQQVLRMAPRDAGREACRRRAPHPRRQSRRCVARWPRQREARRPRKSRRREEKQTGKIAS
jgi:hypothetical protein